MSGNLAAQIVAELLAAIAGDRPVLVATIIAAPADASRHVGAKMLVRSDGSALGRLDGDALDAAVKAEALEAFRRHGVETLYFAPGGSRLNRTKAGKDT